MKLYYHPISTYSQKVLLAMHEKGIEFEPEIVMLMDPDARAKYLEVYSLGKIPLLVLDNGHRIPESSIIVEYLDGVAEPKLIRGSAEQQRQVRFKDRMLDLYLNENVAALMFQGMKPEVERDQERIERARFQIDTLYRFMDRELATQPFAAGAEFSMADCAAAPPLFYAQQVAPYDAFDNIAAYYDRLDARESVQKVRAEAAPALRAFMEQNAA